MFYVPVVDQDNKPLMPTTLLRAKRWIASRKATYFYKKGKLCVRLNQKPSGYKTQRIAVGIDPGSKREAFTVKSAAHTYLNVLTDTVDWVKDAVESKRNARRSRRQRKTPCRQNKFFRNRGKNHIPPSTKARWQWKLRLCKWLKQMFPVTDFVVEDVAAKTKEGQKRWNKSFSPLEVGKQWFYSELEKLGKLYTFKGYETKEMRDKLGLKKSSAKLADKFECHNVDSWVLANEVTGGHLQPDNKKLIRIIPLQFHRRQLHMFQPDKGNIRRNYGGTRSLGLTRGSIVRHNKLGVTYVGGTSKGRVSLHCVNSGKRLTQNARTDDLQFLCYNSWRLTKLTEDGVSSTATKVA